MRGLWLENNQLRVRTDLPRPEPMLGEALVAVTVAGICNTDLELVRGYYPFTGILGHEFVGRVASAPGHDEWVGRRVVGEINAVCHDCDACHRGHARHCERRTVLGIVGRNGAFADYLILPVENLRKVPDDLADDMATFVEPLAAALEIAEQVAIDPRDRVLVIGDGKLGQLVAQALRLRTDSLTVIGRHAEKLRLLAARGIPTMKSGEHYAGRADIVVECTGNPEGLALAIQAVRPRGTIVLKSTYKGQAALDMARLVVDEITLVGSRCGPFPPAIDLLARGAIDPRPLISARFPLDEATVAFEKAVQPGVLKVLIDIQAQEQS